MDRQDFLDNIRRSLQSSQLPDVPSNALPAPSLRPFDSYQLETQFTEQALAVNSEVHQIASHTAGCQLVCDILTQHKATRFMSWGDEFLPIPGINSELIRRGFQLQVNTIPKDSADRLNTYRALSDVNIGLTGAIAGLSDTGSVVVSSGHGRGRLISLLPLIHIVLLEAHLLFPTIAHFVNAHPDAAKHSSNLVFITGPSRSADIEQTMTLGAHGPKELHVILMTTER